MCRIETQQNFHSNSVWCVTAGSFSRSSRFEETRVGRDASVLGREHTYLGLFAPSVASIFSGSRFASWSVTEGSVG